jgi:hypothetical protein
MAKTKAIPNVFSKAPFLHQNTVRTIPLSLKERSDYRAKGFLAFLLPRFQAERLIALS